MGLKDSLRKLMIGDESYYERAARAAADVVGKKAVRGRIAEQELKGLSKLTKKPDQKERLLSHVAIREKGLKKVSFITAWRNTAAIVNQEGR